MGVVYRAEDPVIHRKVAVKVLPTVNGLTPEQTHAARERFSREGRALGCIDHPNIVRVFDVGEDSESGEMYIVMEFVSGPTLESKLREGALGREDAVAIIGQLASGLDAAHACGIIHRDIKSSNILVAEDGTAKIADFGITLMGSSALTQDMRQLGTPAYMSPEQVNGKVLDSKADLFSLGVMTYEILAGRKPFEGVNVVSIVHAIAHAKPIPISVANPELPQALDSVMERILAKEPSDRFATGMEFHAALQACLLDEVAGGSAKPVFVAQKRPAVFWAIAAVAVLVAAFMLFTWKGRSGAPFPGPPISRAEIPTVAEVPPAKAETKAIKPPVPAKPPAPRARTKAAPAKTSPHPKVPASGGRLDAVNAEPQLPAQKVAPTVAPVPMVDVTISFAHRLRRGTLVVLLDGVAIFNEQFSKAKLAVIQTTVWDPLKAPAGGHTLTVRVNGEDGATYVSDPYKFEFSPEDGIELRIGLKGNALTVKQKAG